MSPAARFAYAGDPQMLARITSALERVVDPEVGLNIVSLGLVQRVEARASSIDVWVTMTSAACPVAEHVLEEGRCALRGAFPGARVEVELDWDPPWTPERMSESARVALGWE